MSECEQPKPKKAKVHGYEEEEEENGSAGEEEEQVEVLKNDSGEKYFDLSAKKRVTVRKWQGNVLIDIREVRFYV